MTTTDKKDKDKENGHEVKPTVSAATTNNPPIVVMDDDDDPLLLLALNQSQQGEGTRKPALSYSTEKNEEDLSVQVSSLLDQALELKLNGISNDQYTVIEVTRKHLVERAFEQLVDEDIKGRVIVKFIGEEGVDTGGMTREFFTNYFHGLSNSGNIFRGSYPNLHNLHALEEGQFEFFGKLTAVALLNGCPGPHFLCHSVASFILDNPQEVGLDEVPTESEFKTKLVQIQSCNNETDLSELISSFSERFDMGYTKPVISLKDKDDLVRFCSKHIVISSVAEEIFSFRRGLSAFGVLHELCNFFQAGLTELVYQDVNTDDVKACFKPCFSPVGTNEHAKETEIVYKWQQFLKKTKGGKLVSNVLACPDWNDPDEAMCTDDSPVVKALSLGDILQFGSGSRFPNFKGSLAFDHQCTDAYKRITGNTCARIICIPVNERYTKCNTEVFASNCMEDIFEDYGLGQR